MSHETIRKYLKDDLNLKAYKSQVQPLLTAAQKEKRQHFCKEKAKWTADDWKKVIFSDEAPFELFHHPNSQTDRVWARSIEDVAPTQTVKFPLKIMVWGMMSYCALSDLHIIPQGQTVTGKYYVEEILEKADDFAMYGAAILFPGHPYIESDTALSNMMLTQLLIHTSGRHKGTLFNQLNGIIIVHVFIIIIYAVYNIVALCMSFGGLCLTVRSFPLPLQSF